MLAALLAALVAAVPTAPALGFATLDDQVVYFVMVDRFHDGDPRNAPDARPGVRGRFWGGDLAGVRARLPYLQDLGVSAVWLTPIADQVDAPFHGTHPYHGYWTEDFRAIEPRFGDEDELRALLDDAHARGIRVVLDVVMNHTGYGSRLARDPAWTRAPETGTCPTDAVATDVDRCLFGLPDLRTESPAVRKWIVDATLSWVERFPVDGFRFDTFKHVEPEVFAQAHREAERVAREKHGAAGFLALGEWWGMEPGDADMKRMLAAGAMDTAFDFSFRGLVEGFLGGRMRAEALARHLRGHHEAEGPPLAHFLDNHDVPTLVHSLGPRARVYPLAAAMQMTVRGIPVVTWGDELGRTGGGGDPDNRPMMDWSLLATPRGAALHAWWRDLVKLRRASPALQGRAYRTIAARTDTVRGGASIAYLRGDPRKEEAFVVALSVDEPSLLVGAFPVTARDVVIERVAAWNTAGDRPTFVLQTDHDGTTARIMLPADAAAVWRVGPRPMARPRVVDP